MNKNRRTFIKTSGLIGAGFPIWSGIRFSGSKEFNKRNSGQTGIQLRFQPYELKLKHAFTIANNSRTTTPVMLTEVEFEGVTGYGEASMPPYLGENQITATAFLSKVNLQQFKDPFRLEEILSYIDSLAEFNTAAKASIDIALHDLIGKLLEKPLYKLWGLSKEKTPYTSFTIGIDTDDIVRQKVNEADGFKILKVKLGRDNDKQMIETIRSVSQVPLCVDVNQGWKDKKAALDMIYWLKDKGIVFVEQPMPKELIDDCAWLTQHSPLPIMGDESVQRLADIKKAYQVYSGINIKLMKCTGLREAHSMIEAARALGMKVMLGCMTETSCAVSAAAQLSPLADWADLDGNLLIGNDVFEGVLVQDGKLVLPDIPGIGVLKK
jgi:L-Ala-D/L-Glu epimerase